MTTRDRVMRLVNRAPALLLRSPLHSLLDGRFLLISFYGRKSGKRYTTPINYARDGDTFILTTDSPWWKNLRGGAAVTLCVRGRTTAGVAEVSADCDVVREALEQLLRAVPWYGKFAGVRLGPDGRLDPAAAAAAVRAGRVAIRVRPVALGTAEPRCAGAGRDRTGAGD